MLQLIRRIGRNLHTNRHLIMSHCIVPHWNGRHQRQAHQGAEEEEEEGTTTTTSSHVHTQSLNLLPMSTKYEVAELTWENGQVAMHGLGQILPTSPTKSTWAASRIINNDDTLESIVHQATTIPHNPNHGDCLTKKRMRESVSEPGGGGRSFFSSSVQDDCASASATFCWGNNDTAAMLNRRVSLDESSRSLKTITTAFDEDSAASHGGSENRDDHDTKSPVSARRNRAAAVHNQSERRRRDRINQKMKTLQKLVPNASKTDKASILDEVIEYLKQLQAQIRLMSTRNINMAPQMMMQHQLHQMALLARMAAAMPASALGMGMGMMDMPNFSRNAAVPPPHHLIGNTIPVVTPAPPFVPPPFVGDATVAGTSVTAGTACAANSVPFSDPYSAFLAQSMNMEFYNKMATLYTPQANHQTKSSKLQSSFIHGQGH